MTCDKHTGGCYSIPCSHSVSPPSILSLLLQMNRSDTLRTKSLSILIGLQERENMNTRFFFLVETGWGVLFCPATARLKEIRDVWVV